MTKAFSTLLGLLLALILSKPAQGAIAARTPTISSPIVRSASATPGITGPFNFYNVALGKCIDVPGFGAGRNGGPINQYDCNYTHSDNQQWFMKQRSTNYRGHPVFQIFNANDGRCIDLPGKGAVMATTKVIESHCRAKDNQYFYTVGGEGGNYYFHHLASPGLCLDVDGFATGGNDARLTLWHCSSKDDHLWRAMSSAPFDGSPFSVSERCHFTHVWKVPVPLADRCLSHGIFRQPTPDGADDIDGQWAGRELASFSSVSAICNWRINYLYYGDDQELLRNDSGPLERDCDRLGTREVRPGYLVQVTNAGKVLPILRACAVLTKDGGDEVLRQCLSIKP